MAISSGWGTFIADLFENMLEITRSLEWLSGKQGFLATATARLIMYPDGHALNSNGFFLIQSFADYSDQDTPLDTGIWAEQIQITNQSELWINHHGETPSTLIVMQLENVFAYIQWFRGNG